MKVAALDLGSNTFLCLICEVVDQKISKIYHDEVQMVRLGQGLSQSQEKKFHPQALQRADNCLENFKRTIEAFKPEHILAMATSAARDAKNAEALFELGKKHRIPIEIIPGDMEAQITYQGATSGLPSSLDEFNKTAVIDIGGGSTEFIFGHGGKIEYAKSYNIGCVRLTEEFIHQQPTPVDQIEKVEQHIRNQISQFKKHIEYEAVFEILAIAGTPTALVMAELRDFDPDKIDGFRLTKDKLLDWKYNLSGATIEEKIKMGIPQGRADVILIGVITLLEALELFGKSDLMVSTRGVRHGVALEIGRRFCS